jgi:hypothetical protein
MQNLRMRCAAITGLLILCSWIFLVQLSASPLPPIVRAATSGNGRFLVIATFDLGAEGEGGGRKILGTTFDVNPVETFALNSKDRLTAPNRYYSSESWNSWKVRLPADKGWTAQWPIISDDGESLILVGVSPPMEGLTLLTVYKRHGYEGTLLRSYKVDDLWGLRPGEKRMQGFSDATPEWFADGSFSFSEDGQVLLYTDKEHGVFRLNLKDGAVTKGM